MSVPLATSVVVTPAEEDGSAAKAVSLAGLDAYTVREDITYRPAGSGTQVVPLGSLPSPVMVLVVHILPTSTTEVAVRLNGDATGTTLSAGGFLVVTRATLTALSLIYGGAAAIRVLALG